MADKNNGESKDLEEIANPGIDLLEIGGLAALSLATAGVTNTGSLMASYSAANLVAQEDLTLKGGANEIKKAAILTPINFGILQAIDYLAKGASTLGALGIYSLAGAALVPTLNALYFAVDHTVKNYGVVGFIGNMFSKPFKMMSDIYTDGIKPRFLNSLKGGYMMLPVYIGVLMGVPLVYQIPVFAGLGFLYNLTQRVKPEKADNIMPIQHPLPGRNAA